MKRYIIIIIVCILGLFLCYFALLHYGKMSYNDGYKECLLDTEKKQNDKQNNINMAGNVTRTFSDIIELLKDANKQI